MTKDIKPIIITLIKNYPDPEIAADHILALIEGIKAQIKTEMIKEIDKLTGGYYLQEELNLLSQVKKALERILS